MCTGCDQLPEEFLMVHTSHVPILGDTVGVEIWASWPLTVQPPLARLNSNVRCTAVFSSRAEGRGSGLSFDGTWLGSAAFAVPWTMNFRTGTPGSMMLPVGPRPLVCSQRFTRYRVSPSLKFEKSTTTSMRLATPSSTLSTVSGPSRRLPSLAISVIGCQLFTLATGRPLLR